MQPSLATEPTIAEDCDKESILSWHDICVDIPVETGILRRLKGPQLYKPILKNVNGQAKVGRLCALMGASGAGKTTLLNVLSRNLKKTMKMSGRVLLNGYPVDINKVSAFVQQVDLFFVHFTVKEHLTFHIKLQLGDKVKKEKRKAIMLNLLETFHLKKCLNSIIGDGVKVRGISGGERKRLSLATQIIREPKVIFADEPTSGLDTFMAHSVVICLRNLSKQGTIVICTIHQPSSLTFSVFSDLVLLGNGGCVGCGSRKKFKNIFKKAGFPCASEYNPADHYIEMLSIVRDKPEESIAKIEKIKSVAQSEFKLQDPVQLGKAPKKRK